MSEAGHGITPFKPPSLAELPPLEVLDAECLAALEDELSWIALPGGQALFQEGEPADSLSAFSCSAPSISCGLPEACPSGVVSRSKIFDFTRSRDSMLQ